MVIRSIYIIITSVIELLINLFNIICISKKSKPYRQIHKNNMLQNYHINKNGFNNIDHIYILNLKKNIDRRTNIANMLNKFYIKTYYDNIFYGFNGNQLNTSKKELISKNIIDEDYSYYFPIKPLYFNIWRSNGCMGHYISFYQIFQNAIFNNLEYFMIIEDDAIFNENILLLDYITIMKDNNCDFLSLGQSKTFYNNNKMLINSKKYIYEKLQFKIFKISDSNGLFQQTHTVIFKTEGIKKIISNYFPMKCPTDVMLGNLSRNYETTIRNNILFQTSKCNQKLNGLFVYPPLSEQNNNYKSDIEIY